MPDDFQQVQQHFEELTGTFGKRNEMDNEMEAMFLLDWGERDKVEEANENVKVTLSTDGRDKLLGAVRLLISNDPQISMPHDKNNPEALDQADTIEKAATMMWQAAGRIRGNPLTHDVVLSMALWAEVCIGITKTEDLVNYARESDNGMQARYENIAKQTPFLYDVWDPRTCYPEFGSWGMTSFFRKVQTQAGNVMDEFGAKAKMILADTSRLSSVTLCQGWGSKMRYAWLLGGKEPILEEDYKLPFIPVVCQLGEGSRIFARPEQQRQPFLYTLWKSGLWNRENLLLTVLFTQVFGIGSNPMFVYSRSQSDKKLALDFTRPGGVAYVDAGESLVPMVKNVIDPSMMQALDLAGRASEEATIYGPTLGEPIGGAPNYSMTALLHQAGRLPLYVPQLKSGWGIGDALKISLDWIKHDGTKATIRYRGTTQDIKPADIPDYYELEAALEIKLPQDKLQMGTVANELGKSGHVSKRWTQENILGIGQPDQMQKEIWGEQAAQLQAEMYFTQQMLILQQLKEQVKKNLAPTTSGAPPEAGTFPSGQPPEGPPTIPPDGQGAGMPPVPPMPGAGAGTPPMGPGGPEMAPPGGA